MSNGRNPDRLGDAVRELARTMAESGKDRMRLDVISQKARAIYEIRLVRTISRSNPKVHYLPRPMDTVIEVEAFGPESKDPRQMAERQKR